MRERERAGSGTRTFNHISSVAKQASVVALLHSPGFPLTFILILDGNSVIGAHVYSAIGTLICLGHLLPSTGVDFF